MPFNEKYIQKMWYIYPVKDYSRGRQISEFKGSLLYRSDFQVSQGHTGRSYPEKTKTKNKQTNENKQTNKNKQKKTTQLFKMRISVFVSFFFFQENAWK